MNKKIREEIYNKFGGLCAYTGKPLGEDWQIDHVTPHLHYRFKLAEGDVNNKDNLFPALRIVNHYKRAHGLEGFRKYMKSFHKRLAKLPKNTLVEKTKRRKEYMFKIADAFDISIDKPFSGVFYFETILKN